MTFSPLYHKKKPSKRLFLNELVDVTHLKTAIYETDVCAGEVKAHLYLSDGALHVGSCQGFGEIGEGKRYNKQLEDRKQKTI